MNRFRRSAVTGAMPARESLLPWVVAGLLLLGAGHAPAQFRLKLDGPPPMPLLNPHKSEVPVRIAPPEVNFFGGGNAEAKGYGHVLILQNGCQLRGSLSAKKDSEILWQRPDASETLRFPAGAVQRLITTDEVPDFQFERQFERNDGLANAEEPAIRLGQRLVQAAFSGVEFLPVAAVACEYLPRSGAPAGADMLVFKNGDELLGTALSGFLQGPVHWRTAYGQTVDFQNARIAGVRLAGRGGPQVAPPAEATSLVELRTGERLRGKLVALDDRQASLDHACFGTVTIPREQLRRLFPNPQSVVLSGENSRDGWKWMTTGLVTHHVEPAGTENVHWVRLDGAYLLRSEAPSASMPTSFLPGWQHTIPSDLDRFEFQFRLSPGSRYPASCAVTLFGGGGITLCVTINYRGLEFVVVDPGARASNRWRFVPLDRKLSDLGAPRDCRFLVDTEAGTCHIVINGVLVLQIGKEAKDRLVKTDYCIRLQPVSNPKSLLFSNLQILPWSGDMPATSAPGAPSTLLCNGDVVATVPKALQARQWTLESELGPMEFPAEKILMAEFGGDTSSEHTAGRIRLVDGSSVNVDALQWNGRELNAHHSLLGNIHVPLEAVAEIIFDPTPPRGSTAPEIKNAPEGNVILRKLDVIIK